MQIKANDHLNKIRILEENNNRATFELRQLLNMQQRMSNKYVEFSVSYFFDPAEIYILRTIRKMERGMSCDNQRKRSEIHRNEKEL